MNNVSYQVLRQAVVGKHCTLSWWFWVSLNTYQAEYAEMPTLLVNNSSTENLRQAVVRNTPLLVVLDVFKLVVLDNPTLYHVETPAFCVNNVPTENMRQAVVRNTALFLGDFGCLLNFKLDVLDNVLVKPYRLRRRFFVWTTFHIKVLRQVVVGNTPRFLGDFECL